MKLKSIDPTYIHNWLATIDVDVNGEQDEWTSVAKGHITWSIDCPIYPMC